MAGSNASAERHVFMRVPAITADVERLCREIERDNARRFGWHAPLARPRPVEIRPTRSARPSHCYWNVAEAVREGGGELVYGWTIEELRGAFLEAEAHGVLRRDGKLVCVTPDERGFDRILFVPDPAATFDWQGGRYRGRIWLPLSGQPAVAAWIERGLAIHQLLMRSESSVTAGPSSADYRIAFRFTEADKLTYARLVRESAGLFADILRNLAAGTGRKDPCFCGSGRKLKACCGRFVGR